MPMATQNSPWRERLDDGVHQENVRADNDGGERENIASVFLRRLISEKPADGRIDV